MWSSRNPSWHAPLGKVVKRYVKTTSIIGWKLEKARKENLQEKRAEWCGKGSCCSCRKERSKYKTRGLLSWWWVHWKETYVVEHKSKGLLVVCTVICYGCAVLCCVFLVRTHPGCWRSPSLFNTHHCSVILHNTHWREVIMIFSPLSFSDYGAQCCPIPAFSSSVEISGPQVAALNPWWIMCLWEKNGRTELHYPAS